MKAITEPISQNDIYTYANCINEQGQPLSKAVVDIEQGIMIIGSSLHADEEQELLQYHNSEQEHVWGINLYPDKFGTDQFVEFDSMINIRPGVKNFSRSVEDPHIQKCILSIIDTLVSL